MRYKMCDIKIKNSQEIAKLVLYMLDPSTEIVIKKRPVIVICPGGGYKYLSDREGEIIALQFVAMGYHAAVLYYSVAPARYPTALLELGKSVVLLREKAAQWEIDPEKIVIAGFSAGGHLAASYGVFWSEKWMEESTSAEIRMLRPDAMILGYPVITSGQFIEENSFRNLLGEDYEEKKDSVSVENYVNPNTPRTFIWHTCEDPVVPVQNSLLLVSAMVKEKIPVEFHMFEKGGHGLALANRLTLTSLKTEAQPSAAEWIHLVHIWLEQWIKDEEQG